MKTKKVLTPQTNALLSKGNIKWLRSLKNKHNYRKIDDVLTGIRVMINKYKLQLELRDVLGNDN